MIAGIDVVEWNNMSYNGGSGGPFPNECADDWRGNSGFARFARVCDPHIYDFGRNQV